MQGSLPIILLSVGVLVVIAFLKGAPRNDTKKRDLSTAYARRSTLFTQTEAKFLQVLREAVPHYEVFGKVRLEDIVEVRSGSPYSVQTSRRNHINRRHVDYVLCEPGSTRILGVVELDDRSHRSAKAQRSDGIKDAALKSAGVPLLRVPVSAMNDVEGIALKLASIGVKRSEPGSLAVEAKV